MINKVIKLVVLPIVWGFLTTIIWIFYLWGSVHDWSPLWDTCLLFNPLGFIALGIYLFYSTDKYAKFKPEIISYILLFLAGFLMTPIYFQELYIFVCIALPIIWLINKILPRVFALALSLILLCSALYMSIEINLISITFIIVTVVLVYLLYRYLMKEFKNEDYKNYNRKVTIIIFFIPLLFLLYGILFRIINTEYLSSVYKNDPFIIHDIKKYEDANNFQTNNIKILSNKFGSSWLIIDESPGYYVCYFNGKVIYSKSGSADSLIFPYCTSQ